MSCAHPRRALGLALALAGALALQLPEPARAAPDYSDLSGPCFRHVREAARITNVDPALIWAIIYIESRGDPRARSHKGAMGCGQLMPGTAGDLGVDDAYRPRDNVLGLARYLAKLEGWLAGRVDPRFGWLPVVAAYHCGPAPVLRHRGRVPFRQTLKYVSRVREVYLGFRAHWRAPAASATRAPTPAAPRPRAP